MSFVQRILPSYSKATAFIARSCLTFLEFGSLKSYGVLIEDLTVQAGLSYAQTGLILPLQRTICCLLAPFASILIQRVGVRGAFILGGVLAGCGYVGNGLLPWNVFFLTFCCILIGLGYGMAFVPSYLKLKDVFADNDAHFAIAQSLTDQFIFLGMMTLPVVFDTFQNNYGTRGALLLFGGLNLHIIVVGLLLKKTRWANLNPNDVQEVGTSDESNCDIIRQHWQIIVKNAAVRFICLITFFLDNIYICWALFSVTLGKERGLSQPQAVLLSSIAGFGAIFGRLCCVGLFALNIQSPFYYFGIPSFIQFWMLIVLVTQGNNFTLLLTFSFIVGISFGAIGAAVGGLCSLNTSSSEFGPAVTLFTITAAVGNELGGGFSGFLYDCFGSSQVVFIHMACSSLGIFILSMCWTAHKYFTNPD